MDDFQIQMQGSHSDWKNGKTFSSQGILNRHWKSRENHTKYWRNEKKSDKYYLIFLVIFKLTVYYLLKKRSTFQFKRRNIKKKYWKSRGILSVRKSGNHEMYFSHKLLPINEHLIFFLILCYRNH